MLLASRYTLWGAVHGAARVMLWSYNEELYRGHPNRDLHYQRIGMTRKAAQ